MSGKKAKPGVRQEQRAIKENIARDRQVMGMLYNRILMLESANRRAIKVPLWLYKAWVWAKAKFTRQNDGEVSV